MNAQVQALQEEVKRLLDLVDALESKCQRYEELLGLVHVDVVRATGVLVDLDERISVALKGKTN